MAENLSIIVFLGIIVGFVASFLGIGGGAIMVPVLLFVFTSTPLTAIVGISLATIFFNSLLNTYSFYKIYGASSFTDSKKFIFGTIPGSILGSFLLLYTPEKIVKMLFACFLLLQTFKLLKKIFAKIQESEVIKELPYSVIGFIGGVISSLTGLGGGAVFVPLIKSSTNIKTKNITMVSNHIMVLATFIGLLPLLIQKVSTNLPFTHLEIGSVNFGIVFMIVAGSFVSRPIGLKFNNKISDHKKSIILAGVFLILAVKILTKEFL